MEVAQLSGNQKIVDMLTEHEQNRQRQQLDQQKLEQEEHELRKREQEQQQEQQQQQQQEQEKRDRKIHEQQQLFKKLERERRQREQQKLQQKLDQKERERRQREREQQKRQGDRKTEVRHREELMQNKESKAYQEVMIKVAGKSESETREMMSRGEVVTNMWSAIRAQWAEAQQATVHLQQEYDTATAQLRKLRENIVELQKQEKEQEQRVREIEQRMASNKRLQQALEVAEVLAKAEQSGEENLKKQMKKEQHENTLLALEDIGFFLNSLGMARNSRLLFVLCSDDPEMAEMSIVDAGILLAEHIPLSDRLEIQFGIHMTKHKQYPPYQKHWKECAVCKSSVSELATEYEIKLKKEALDEEELSSFGLPFLQLSDLLSVIESNTNTEKLKTMKAIKVMRKNHTNHLIT